MREPKCLISSPSDFGPDVIRYGPENRVWQVPLGIPEVQTPDVEAVGLVVFLLDTPETAHNQHMLLYSLNQEYLDATEKEANAFHQYAVKVAAKHSRQAGYPIFVLEYWHGSPQWIYLVEDVPV